MRREYFVYNNKEYSNGTVVILKRFSIYSKSVCDTKATFLYYDTDTKEYVFKIYGSEYKYTEDDFLKSFYKIYEPNRQITKTSTQMNKKYTFEDELSIDGLLIAWAWYIFIMAVGVIFYDRIVIWILASVVFFDYRNRKLKEAGYK